MGGPGSWGLDFCVCVCVRVCVCVCTQIVESLGPAYIKIAQAVATRVDVMPDAYVQELTRLQDNVATFSTIEARKVRHTHTHTHTHTQP